MNHWLTIICLLDFIFVVFARHHKDQFILTHRILHGRRHKRVDRSIPTIERVSQFVTFDERCADKKRPMMSCPRKDNEPLKCIEFHELCDDYVDCNGGEDENPHFCMFKKLEDAEVTRLKNEISDILKIRPNPRATVNFERVLIFTPMSREQLQFPLSNGQFEQHDEDEGPLEKLGQPDEQYDDTEYEEPEVDEEKSVSNANVAELFRSRHGRTKRIFRRGIEVQDYFLH